MLPSNKTIFSLILRMFYVGVKKLNYLLKRLVQNEYPADDCKKSLFHMKKRNITCNFFSTMLLCQKSDYYSEKKEIHWNYHSSLCNFEIFKLILGILLKEKNIWFYKNLYELKRLVYSKNWIEKYKNIIYYINSIPKYFFLVKRKDLNFFFYHNIHKNLLNVKCSNSQYYYLNKKNRTIITFNEKATICDVYLRFITSVESKESCIQRGILNKITLDNLKDLKLSIISCKKSLFKTRILLLEIFGKTRQEFLYFKLYGNICFIIFFKNLETNLFSLNFLVLFLNFQHKEEFGKIRSSEKDFWFESQTDFFFDSFSTKKNIKSLFTISRNEESSGIVFFFSNIEKKIIFPFLIIFCLKKILFLFNANNIFIKSSWIEILCKLLERQMFLTRLISYCINMLFIFKKNIKKLKRIDLSSRISYTITKILKNLNFL
nr:hypothetical protein 1634Bnrm1_p153 [Cryptomonas sp.]